MNRKLEELSITDEMTRVANFRRFKQLLALEHDRAERLGAAYSLIFCDIDHFKAYNDRNGHPSGDELLRNFAAILKESCRLIDVVARYGGEEFVVLCPDTEERGATALAERLRMSIQAAQFADVKSQPLGFLSMSVGVASFPMNARTQDEVLKKADLCVYHSKAMGRNRVTNFSELARDPLALADALKKVS
jgi:diguanylate cyclase (GGDEF)-like protein